MDISGHVCLLGKNGSKKKSWSMPCQRQFTSKRVYFSRVMCWQKIKEFLGYLTSNMFLSLIAPIASFTGDDKGLKTTKTWKMSWSFIENGSTDLSSIAQVQNSQISSTTNQNQVRIPRTPEHYEMIDQIGKGKLINLKESHWGKPEVFGQKIQFWWKLAKYIIWILAPKIRN